MTDLSGWGVGGPFVATGLGADTAGMADRPSTITSGPAVLVRPMLATPGPIPAGLGGACEIKFDGSTYQLQVACRPGRLRL